MLVALTESLADASCTIQVILLSGCSKASFSARYLMLQGITEAEDEATRKGVQAKTARKAAEKAVADEAKASTQLAGVVEDIAAKEAEMKVGAHAHVFTVTCFGLTCLSLPFTPPDVGGMSLCPGKSL